jgi:hypothetical protein
MAARRIIVTALFLLLGCGPEPAPMGAISMTISPTTVDADGVSFALVEVSGTSVGKVSIRSSLGSFEGLGAAVFFNQAPFSTMLVSCDSRTDSRCAGWALVQASDESLAVSRAQVNFRQLP